VTAMTDLRDRFHRADRLQPPNLWPDVMERANAVSTRSLPWAPNRALRLGLILLALVLLASVAIAAVGALLRKPVPTPPESGWIAYTQGGGWRERSAGDIYLTSLDGTPRPIIGAEGDSLEQACPAFSPDGTLLAYGEDAPAADSHVVIVALDDDGMPSPRHRIAAGGTGLPCPVWSPDGHAVAFLDVSGGLQVAPLNGPATYLHVGATSLAWTYDSSAIATLDGSGDAIGPIQIVPEDGTEPRLLPEAWNRGGLFVTASPVGPSLAVSGEGFMRVLNYEDGHVVLEDIAEATSLFGNGRPAWSPDGTRIAWDFGDGISVRSIDEPTTTVQRGPWVMEGAEDPVGASSGVVWSPDGTRLLFVGHAGGLFAFVSIAAEGPADPLVLSSWTDANEWADQSDVTWQYVNR
jgi:Tol biopolymer transport system component